MIILDLSLPGISGLEVCERLRAWTHIPSSSCRSATARRTKIAALDLGADELCDQAVRHG